MITYMVLISAIKSNMELNACVIPVSYNVPNIATLESAGDKRTQSPSKKGIQVELIRSLTLV